MLSFAFFLLLIYLFHNYLKKCFKPQEINQENGSNLTKNDSLNSSSNQENNDDEIYKDESDDGEEYEGEEEENLIDDLLEKPIDILDEKDQVNFYTYNKIQIKSKNKCFNARIIFIVSQLFKSRY